MAPLTRFYSQQHAAEVHTKNNRKYPVRNYILIRAFSCTWHSRASFIKWHGETKRETLQHQRGTNIVK